MENCGAWDTPYKIESLVVIIRICIIDAMLLSFIKGFVSRTSASVSSVVLGRWGIQYDPKIIRIKIDQANEDHCGCCVPPPTTASGAAAKVGGETTKTKTRYEKIQEYLLPYVM
jgi:hypothetical protein